MNELSQSLEQKGSGHFASLSSRLSLLVKPSVAAWVPIPLRLIAGYGFMQHGFAKLSRGPEAFAAILHAIGAHLASLRCLPSLAALVFGGSGTMENRPLSGIQTSAKEFSKFCNLQDIITS